MTDEVQAVKTALRAKKPRLPPIPPEAGLSTGCTLINLGCSGRASWGIFKGGYLWLVGDSSSGKTWFAFNILAEAALNRNFRGYRFIYDNVENGALMDVLEYFGKAVATRLEPPAGTRKAPRYSRKVQEFYYNIWNAIKDKERRPFIYVVDSMDALDDDSDEKKFEQLKARDERAHGEGGGEEDDKVKGSYGMGKPKANSMNIKRVVNRLTETGSILIIISQTRDKINTPFPMKTAAGGRAMKFYSHVEVWTSVRGDLTRKVHKYGKKLREYGKLLRADVRKNRICGWEGAVQLTFLRKRGVDDVGSNVDYLVEEGHWKKAKQGGKITAPEFDFVGTREKLVRKVEETDSERELQLLVQKVWREIDEATVLPRKKRYE